MIPSMDNGSVRSMLLRGAALLIENGVPNARRNAEWLLCHSLGCSTLDLYTHSGRWPADDQASVFWQNVHRRANREPLQYILGATEFMSRPFVVPTGVFVPRPDTEILVELAEARLRRMPLERSLEALDLCCGSGVIAVSLTARIPNLNAIAVDACALAVATTQKNARRNGVDDRITAVEADVIRYLSSDDHEVSAVLCNPPYIVTNELSNLPPEVSDHEPRAALDGGPDGLDFYRAVTPKLADRLRPGGFAAFEIGDDQGAAVSGMMTEAGLVDVSVSPDFAGCDRVVVGVMH